jgi:hypothetical protein
VIPGVEFVMFGILDVFEEARSGLVIGVLLDSNTLEAVAGFTWAVSGFRKTIPDTAVKTTAATEDQTITDRRLFFASKPAAIRSN